MTFEVFSGEPKRKARWTGLLMECAALDVGESLRLQIAEHMINRFRAILRVSGRTSRWRWTVRKTYLPDHSIEWRVTKIGVWPGARPETLNSCF